jgi:hypothetical protein
MAPDYASSVQGVGLRIAKLDAAGVPIVGAKNCYVTKAFTKFSFTPEYDEGDEISVKAADGSICTYYKLPDTLKRVAVELAICKPQPELYEILGGGTLLAPPSTVTNKVLTSNVATLTIGTHSYTIGDSATVALVAADPVFDGVQTITATTATTISYAKVNANVTSVASGGTVTPVTPVGWAAPTIGIDPVPNGVSIEVWSRAIVGGKPAAVNPYWRWVMPYVKTRLSGDRVLENGELANVFSGFGLDNAGFTDGPANDWPFTSQTTSLQYARSATAPSTEGYITVT